MRGIAMLLHTYSCTTSHFLVRCRGAYASSPAQGASGAGLLQLLPMVELPQQRDPKLRPGQSNPGADGKIQFPAT